MPNETGLTETPLWCPAAPHEVPIEECGEPLVEIPEGFLLKAPRHPCCRSAGTSVKVREGVFRSLEHANSELASCHPGFRLKVTRAHLPPPVHKCLVDAVADDFCRRTEGIVLRKAPPEIRDRAYEFAHALWFRPDDPASPPPNTTGGAIHVTMVDQSGKEVYMGPQDISDKPFSNAAGVAHEMEAIRHRNLLRYAMQLAWFVPFPGKWWHFSQGDQVAVFHEMKENPRLYDGRPVAKYGLVDS
jgi:D-alanyl-D-alanine dipeptidase